MPEGHAPPEASGPLSILGEGSSAAHSSSDSAVDECRMHTTERTPVSTMAREKFFEDIRERVAGALSSRSTARGTRKITGVLSFKGVGSVTHVEDPPQRERRRALARGHSHQGEVAG